MRSGRSPAAAPTNFGADVGADQGFVRLAVPAPGERAREEGGGEKIDRRFFVSLILGLVVILGLAAAMIWLAETDRSVEMLGQSFYWAGATVLGLGEGGFVRPVGWIVGWLLGLFGVAIVATITGALSGS